MVRETSLSTDDLIEPFFVCEGSGVRQEISSMPGVHRLSIDNVVSEVKAGCSLGIPAMILFGIPDKKDDLVIDLNLSKTSHRVFLAKRRKKEIYH